jgi:CRISPR-associated endonuclease/helicase Cas3
MGVEEERAEVKMGTLKIPDYLWAKTTKTDMPGKSVLSHMNDVCAVAGLLLKTHEKQFEKVKCDLEQIAIIAGLHDIGKISPGFQAKCPEWIKMFSLHANYGAPYEKDHSIVTQYTIQKILQENGMKTEPAELWAAILGAHHGRLHKPGVKLQVNDKEWEKKREEIIMGFRGSTSLPDYPIDNSWPFLWWLAGLVSVSDWIGSAEEWFPVSQETTPADSKRNALCALNTIGFDTPNIKQGLSFGDAFIDATTGKAFIQNDLQLKAEQNIQEPGLYIIEAPMGMGKTEAALWCAYQLIQKEKATGFYFALPTQATSNRIHIRVNEFLGRITGDQAYSRLVHAGSWLLDEIKVPTLKSATDDEKESNRDAIDWFASKKRGLIAPFGVGTIDQALMSVIAVKHFFVRQFALAGKVIILDEVHSYDLYTGTLIKTLCERLLSLGCTIILLSATLTKEIKKRFVGTEVNDGKEHYPQISGLGIKPVEVLPPKPKTVKIQVRSENDALVEALSRADHGASVLWVCDTVNKAQQMFDLAKTNDKTNFEIGILHARFPVFRRQELEEYWMEKLGKTGKNRSGCILFSTQIVEQSVDLDADFMVSELAPTDMLLQRMGRLWRHERENRSVDEPAIWVVAENFTMEEFQTASAQNIKKMFGTKAMVYAPYVLLRSLQLLKDKGEIDLPRHIQSMLEETYKTNYDEPKGWLDLCEEIEGVGFALRNAAEFETNVWNLALDDEEGKAKTRTNGLETIQLILSEKQENNKLYLLNGSIIDLKGDVFILQEARSLAMNIVKVPKYCFDEDSKPLNKKLSTIVRGIWKVGFVEAGNVHSTYLKNSYIMRYTPEKGVEIMKNDQRNEVDYEPCD